MNCHQCNGIVAKDDRYCEECGANLIPNPSPNDCQKCGADAVEIDIDRYCNKCGYRQVEIAEDSIELQPTPNLAGASNRGKRHHQNEDSIDLQLIDNNTYSLVVCDGVSSSQNPQLASQAATTACCQAIATAINLGKDPKSAIEQGVQNALKAVTQIAFDPNLPDEDRSSTTIVTAIVQNNIATIAWLGDSRAYWLAETNSQQLTQDDSWVNEVVTTGQMTLEAAEKSPHAHAIVRWLGADVTEEEGKPNILTFTIPGAGYLLLCSDGLWNYTQNPVDIYHLIQQTDGSSMSISRHLVEYANQQGGRDNITVGVLAIDSF